MVQKYGDLFLRKNFYQTQGNYFLNMCDKLPQEKLHLNFCKQMLRVNSKATNLAVRGETGRYPLLIKILANMFKYLIHIKTSKNNLLTEAYELSENLSNKGIDSWANFLKSILTFLNIKVDIKSDCKHLYRKVLQALIIKFNSIWKERIQSNHGENIQKGNKLRTYALFKQNFNMEKYLQFGSRNQRRNLCKFRISNHKLEIEQGRYKNISAGERTCKLCNTGVEDEIHFLLTCSVLENIRKTTLSVIYKLYPNTENLNDKDKFIWLMTTENPDMLHLLQQMLSSLSEERISKLNS